MFIQRLNIFLLSFLIIFAPTYTYALSSTGLFVNNIIKSGTTRIALMVGTDSAGVIVATYAMEATAASIGLAAADLVLAGSAGYAAGTQLNNKFGISDYVSIALAGGGYTIANNQINTPLDPNLDHTVNAIYSLKAYVVDQSQPYAYYQNPTDACKELAIRTSQVFTSVSPRNDGTGGYFCFKASGLYGSTRYDTNPKYISSATKPTIPATSQQIGTAILANEAALAETIASTAMSQAAKNTTSINNCAQVGGTFNINNTVCSNPIKAANPCTYLAASGQVLTTPDGNGVAQCTKSPAQIALEEANVTAHDADLKSKTANATAALAKTAVTTAENELTAARANMVANPTDPAAAQRLLDAESGLSKAKETSKSATDEATRANTESTAANGTAQKASEDLKKESETPDFCKSAAIVCQFINWFQKDDVLDTPDNTVDVRKEDMDNDLTNQLNTQRITGNASCPPDINIPFHLGMISSNIVIPFAPFCMVATQLRPFVILISYVGACYIITGSSRRGDA